MLLVTSVKFSQSTYSVNENSGVVQPVLVLSNPSSTDITVEVTSTDGSATGELILFHRQNNAYHSK